MHDTQVKDRERTRFDDDGIESEDWEDVYDPSWDSFPASDPPSWMGMRIGGPPRPSPVPNTVTQIVADGPSEIVESAARPFDSQWVAGQWPCVHICHAAFRVDGERGGDRRPVLNAVVQLGELAPADVHVTARRIVDDSESAADALLRLWSVQSHRNGSFVFEAETHPDVLGDASQIGIVVQPAAPRTDAAALSDIVRHLSATESGGCGSCARAALA
ncbi:MAG: hypothetical protein M3Y05_07000 [Gemmatimonadota bacterium]|nr:hypothetical protein [Gemmatimonadota bacterium]